ncbi:MAG: nodulation protein NfeD [Ignavibacteria bacterium]|nr:nodulation protein NfeD [Ignavibacteria bacterium]
MKKIIFILLFSSLYTVSFSQTAKKVYVIEISGEIDLGLAPYVERVINDAEEEGFQAILLKVNTFGGRVDAATRIKDALLKSNVLTIAFVNNRAISAGALITISAQKIAMAPGSSMGATTVVDQSGQYASEKYQSYMRSEMRSTAERNKRRPDIAEAMVDQKVVLKDLPELDDSTKLLTLTTEEAHKYGYCDFISSDVVEVLEHFGIEDPELIYSSTNWAEEVVRFLSNPIISGILIMIGIVGLFTEVKTPGWGLPGTAGIIALVLFFGTNYILQLANIWEILIFIIGLALLLIEIFYIPGFGFVGVIGILMMIGSIFFGLLSDFPIVTGDDISAAIIQLAFSIVLGIISIVILSKFLPKTTVWNRLILSQEEKIQEGFSSNPDLSFLLGKMGKAVTQLRPAGIALIENKRIDVVTEGEFIAANSEISVMKVEGSKVIVRESKV